MLGIPLELHPSVHTPLKIEASVPYSNKNVNCNNWYFYPPKSISPNVAIFPIALVI